MGWKWVVTSLAAFGIDVASASAKTGFFEVDLLFPRNITFAPGRFPPFVFAVQNPGVAYTLCAVLDWVVWQYGTERNLSTEFAKSIDLYSLNDSVSNPYFVSGYMAPVSYDSIWYFAWGVTYNSCSVNATNGQASFSIGGPSRNYTIFTSDSKAQPVDLVVATSAQTCSSRQNFAFNVTGSVGGFEDILPNGICALLDQEPPLEPNPCAVQLSSDTAASIYASNSAAASEGCYAPLDYNNNRNNPSCPISNPFRAASASAGPSATATSSATVLIVTAGLPLLMALGCFVGTMAVTV